VVEQLRCSYPDKEIHLNSDLKALKMPLTDTQSLTRKVSNILFNAVEAILVMSKREKGHIYFHTSEFEQNNLNTIKLLISNDGPPIPKEKLNSIFDPFISSGKKTGTGLGGTIKAENLLEKNLVQFVLTIPASQEDELKKVNFFKIG
jgi:signal transduction histidine kinase